MMKGKIQYKKYKREYGGLLFVGIWVFILFWFSDIIYGRCVAQCPANITINFNGLRILILFTGIALIAGWFFLKYGRDNYTLIELEGDVIEPKRGWL